MTDGHCAAYNTITRMDRTQSYKSSVLGFQLVQFEPVGGSHHVQDEVVSLSQRCLVGVDPLQHLHAHVVADVGPVCGDEGVRDQRSGQRVGPQRLDVRGRRSEEEIRGK